jgi:hypothetical protein
MTRSLIRLISNAKTVRNVNIRRGEPEPWYRHGRGETAHRRSSAAELVESPVCVCWKECQFVNNHGGEMVAYKAMIQLDRTRFHERLVSGALLSRFLVFRRP